MTADLHPLDLSRIPRNLPSDQYKRGDEYAPFHPQASHVPPDYRDGWNRCWLAAAAAGEVVVTKNEAGQIVAVTRQDMEGHIISVIAESAAPSPVGQAGALPEARIERTPQDYAMGKADHMAVIGDQLLASLEALSAAELVLEESGEDDDGAVADARDTVWEFVRALRSGIYEFRKRRDRALAAPSASAPLGWKPETEKNAARYEWIRTHVRGTALKREQFFQMPHPKPISNIMKGSVAQNLDAAIDAAMLSASPSPGEPQQMKSEVQP